MRLHLFFTDFDLNNTDIQKMADLHDRSEWEPPRPFRQSINIYTVITNMSRKILWLKLVDWSFSKISHFVHRAYKSTQHQVDIPKVLLLNMITFKIVILYIPYTWYPQYIL